MAHEQEIYLITSLDVNCLAFESQTGRNYYVYLRQTYLAWKLKFVKGCRYLTYTTKEVKKELNEEPKLYEGTLAMEEGQEAPVPFVIHRNNTLHLIFPIVEVYINNPQNTTLMDCMRTNHTIPTTSAENSPNTKEFCSARCTNEKYFLMKF